MSTSEELYGVKPELWCNLSYISALEMKNLYAKNLIVKLQEQPHGIRDFDRIGKINRAMTHNNYLINEAKGK